MERKERRNIRQRAAVVQNMVNSVVENPSVTLTVETLQMWLNVPRDAASRMLLKLASSGLVREIKRGVFVRGTLQPSWR
jgi:predicted transcriptional regulator